MAFSKVHPATDYQVVGHDEHSYTVLHPQGHHFKVAKEGLSPEMHAKIQKFSAGGMVQPEDSVSPEQAWDSIVGAPSPEPQSSWVNPIQDATSVLINKSNSPIANAPPAPTLDAGNPQASMPPPTPSATPPPEDPYATAQKQFNQSILEQQKALAGAAVEQGKLGGQESKIQEAGANTQKSFGDQLQAIQRNENAANDAMYNKAAASEIDPKRLWNAPTTDRLMGTIGIILGGLGGGISGRGGNVALDIINNAISKDIDAQKANLENKHSLLNFNLKRYGDEKLATLATANQMTAATKGFLASAAAKAQGPLAKQNALMGIGQLDQQIAENNQKMALFHIKNMVETQPFDKSYIPILDAEQHKRLVQLDNGQMSLTNDEAAAKDVRDAQTAYGPIMSHLNTLDSLQGLKAFTPSNSRLAKSAVAGLSLELDRLHGLKRISDAEYERSKQQIGDPSTLSGYVAGQSARDELRKTVEGEKDSTLRNAIPAYKSKYNIAGTRPTGKKIR